MEQTTAYKRILSGPSLTEKIAQSGGKASGFDYLRLILAVLIICFHSIVICYGVAAQVNAMQSLAGALFGLLVPMFFSLSGFLVAGSLERSGSLAIFLGLRVMRIIPALLVDTIFSAILVGALVTSLSFAAYIADPSFHSYFLNILGDIHYTLPGVFDGNPSHKVNGQLWTIPYELECYLVLSALAFIGIHRKPRLFLFIGLAVMLALEMRLLVVSSATAIDGRILLLCFLSGVVCYLYRNKIRWNVYLFTLSLVAMVAIHAYPRLAYLAPIPATYMTVYLGLFNPKKISLINSGDYSYGLFLYGYPVQQLLVATMPFAREWFGHLLLAIPSSLLLAALSWHLVEKRVLSKKTLLFAMQKKWSAWQLPFKRAS